MKPKTFPIFLSFFVMGFGDAVGTLVGFATKEFALSKWMAGFLPFFALIAYGIFSVPTGILSDNKGKKFVLLLGLIIVIIGELIPVVSISRYGILLVAIFLIGTGMTVLQVAGNPIMRDVSEEGRYSRNLTFAQFIKSIGTISAPYIVPLIVVLGFSWKGIFPIYAILALVTLISVSLLKVEAEHIELESRASLKSSFGLLKNSYVFLMVLGIFLYIGAEIGLNSWIATYLNDYYGFDIEKLATLGIGFFLTALAIGRLFGSAILHFLSAKKFFLYTSLLGCLGIAGLFLGSKVVSLISIFVAGLAFGNIFPLIFSILIDHLPEKSSELSGLMCMAIVGGAIMPLLMGVIADYDVMLSFLLPLVAVIYIVAIAIKSLKIE